MPIFDLYSSRMAKERTTDDVWEYERIPDRLRVQVSNLVRGALGKTDTLYEMIHEAVAHEHGRSHLGSRFEGTQVQVHQCIKSEQTLLVWLDVVELCFRVIERKYGKFNAHERRMRDITIPAAEAVDELNERFRRAGFGYRYEDGSIIRVDNEFMHQEATRPALALLSDPRFAGANDEFRAAHNHYKAGEYKDCGVDALNALESTMKAICDAKKWEYPRGARASDLIKILRRENLFPEFADQSFEQLLATLKSGLPAVRNEAGGHGQGAKPV